MHNAPSVVFPVGRCVFYALLLGVLGLLSGAVVVAFFVGMLQQADRQWARMAAGSGMCLWFCWVAGATVAWQRTAEGALRWDARAPNEWGHPGAWMWCAATGGDPVAVGQVECTLDLQSVLLLRCRSASSAPSWIWVERRSCPALWTDLRRALVSSRG